MPELSEDSTSLFDWDRANVSHIARHDVTKEEAEEALLSDPLDAGYDPDVNGEQRWTYLGATDQGRILTVVVTMRGAKMRVVTAYDAEKPDKAIYLEMKASWQ